MTFLLCWLGAGLVSGLALAIMAEFAPVIEEFDWERDHLPFDVPMPLRLVRG